MKMLLAVPALALFCAPALARPDRDPPPGAFKADVQVHMATMSDGRGDRGDVKAFGTDRFGRDSYDRQPTRAQDVKPETYGSVHQVQLPFKAEVQQKMQNGDNREGSAQKAPAAQTQPASKPNEALMGRQQKPAPIPMKTQIMLRVETGDSPDGAAASKSPAAKHADGAQHRQPLSRQQKEALCKQTGFCMPTAAGSDDVEDKTE